MRAKENPENLESRNEKAESGALAGFPLSVLGIFPLTSTRVHRLSAKLAVIWLYFRRFSRAREKEKTRNSG